MSSTLTSASAPGLLPAIALIAVAQTLIPSADMAGKVLANSFGVAPFFVAWSRFVIGALLILPFLPRHQFDARLYLDWRIWLRALFITGVVAFILTALKTEDVATVFGAFFVGPIVSYTLSALFLNERVTLGQTALLALGFCGVLFVVRPGFGMTSGALYAVAAGCCYGGFLTCNRWLGGIAPPRALLMSQLVIGALVLTPFGLPVIPAMTAPIAALTFASAALSMAGNLLLIFAYRRATASRLAPFIYFQLVAATTLGFFVFGTVPDSMTLVGVALLVSSGVMSLGLKRV